MTAISFVLTETELRSDARGATAATNGPDRRTGNAAQKISNATMRSARYTWRGALVPSGEVHSGRLHSTSCSTRALGAIAVPLQRSIARDLGRVEVDGGSSARRRSIPRCRNLRFLVS